MARLDTSSERAGCGPSRPAPTGEVGERWLLARTTFVGAFFLAAGCGGSASSAASPDHHHPLHLPPVGSSIAVLLDGEPRDVEVAGAAGGKSDVPLVTLVQSAWPNVDPARLQIDLVGSDGFRPRSRPKCTHLLAGDEATHLRVAVASHDVSVDPGLSLPGCYHVRAVVRIEATTLRP